MLYGCKATKNLCSLYLLRLFLLFFSWRINEIDHERTEFLTVMRPISDKFIIFRANYDKMMNRIFHVKIAGGTYLFLILLTAVTVFAFWCMKAMIGWVVASGLIITVERIIHSTYTLTADGKLVVYRGRFYKGKSIPLTDITDVELKRSPGFGGMLPSKYVLIHYEKKNLLSLVPVKPEEFIRALVKRLEHGTEEE